MRLVLKPALNLTSEMPRGDPTGVGSLPFQSSYSLPSRPKAVTRSRAPGLNVSWTSTAVGTTGSAYSSSSHSSWPSGVAEAHAVTMSPAPGVSGSPVACSGPQLRLGGLGSAVRSRQMYQYGATYTQWPRGRSLWPA